MTIDFGSFILKPLQTLALVVLLVAIKAWVLRTILRFSAVPRQQRIWLAMVLSQSGELAFVVIAYAIEQHALPSELGSQLMIIIALSMLTTPILMVYADRRSKTPARQQTNTGLNAKESADSQVIVAGFGRVGQVIARLMRENNFRTVVIDHNPNRFDQLRQEGFIGFYGDVLRPDLQLAAGIEKAAVMVIAIDDPERAHELVSQVRREYPHITISCRALDQQARGTLLEVGADRAYSESFESALLMGEDVLEMMGVSPLDARTITETYRDAAESS
jgi:glutathione-regulated potassium-efflux system ancillary protein KefC